MLTGIQKELEIWFRYRQLAKLDAKAGAELKLIRDRTSRISKNDIVLVACMRNEAFRIPKFVEYYRSLGVNHFIFIDNASDDELQDIISTYNDVSCYYTQGSYLESAFGMRWANVVLHRHCVGNWIICVDPDEFLVFPFCETRTLPALTTFLEEEKRASLHTITLDAYSAHALEQTELTANDDPFDICPYFDRDGYTQRLGWGNGTWIQGGPRLRVHFRDKPDMAPALNKIPLVKWGRSYHYRNSQHDGYPLWINRAHTPGNVSITGALFHFKFVSTLREKAQEEAVRKQHYASGREYERYRTQTTPSLFVEGLSERYEDSDQLIRLGLMCAGGWF